MKTLYDILDSHPEDSVCALKKAYHRMLLKFHPDKQFPLDPATSFDSASSGNYENQLDEITKAWRILSNEQSRRQYDSWMREQLLREDNAVLFDSVNINDVLDSWTPITEPCDTNSQNNDGSSYVLDCRCGGHYVFSELDSESLPHETLYLLCSNCSLVVKVDQCQRNS